MFANNMGCRVAMRGTTGEACRKKHLAWQLAMALGSLALAAQAAAQNTSGADQSASTKTVNLQGITVTGSNIRSADVEAAQPVVTLTAQDIQKQGFATVGQLSMLSSTPSPSLSERQPAVPAGVFCCGSAM